MWIVCWRSVNWLRFLIKWINWYFSGENWTPCRLALQEYIQTADSTENKSINGSILGIRELLNISIYYCKGLKSSK